MSGVVPTLTLLRSLRSGGVFRGRRAMSAIPGSARLPRWGSFGKQQEEVKSLEAAVRKAGDEQIAFTRAFAEIGLRTMATISRPSKWFDSSWRDSWASDSGEELSILPQSLTLMLEHFAEVVVIYVTSGGSLAQVRSSTVMRE